VTEHVVEIKNISIKFPGEKRYALDSISAAIPKGKMIGLAGPDGAGKTTLLRLIAALLLPTNGTISVFGVDTVQDPEAIHRAIGYMPQKFGLYEDLTVMQNLTLYADLRSLDTSVRKEVFDELLAFTALGLFTDRLAGKLSGGMKQKLGLACALIKKPKLLLLDEPAVGVDPISRRQLWKMVKALLEEDISVIWSTAYLDEAEKCDSVMLLHEGKLLFEGNPDTLTKRVEGRVFVVKNSATNKRSVLSNAIKNPGFVDAVIQGSDVRLVVKPNVCPTLEMIGAEASCAIDPACPRFEDAFMDILGGFTLGASPIAEEPEQERISKQAIIDAQNLTKRFGSFTAVDAISLSIAQGEIFGLLGPNGAGKTTTFKMMCGLSKPTIGSAYVNGVSLLKAGSEARSHIGYMAQKFSLYGNLSVKQNLEFFSGIYNLKNSLQKQAIDEAIQIFDLREYLDVNADILPLGFKQRLALSCALMHRPAVLFLDEPTSGVDPITRREFWMHINALVEKGVTVMVTTHFMDEAEYCDRIALIYKGQLVTLGTPDDLKEEARSKEMPNPSLEDAFIHCIERFDEVENGTR